MHISGVFLGVHTLGVVLGLHRGVHFWRCLIDSKRCILLGLCYGYKKVHSFGVVLGMQRGEYFWCCVRDA